MGGHAPRAARATSASLGETAGEQVQVTSLSTALPTGFALELRHENSARGGADQIASTLSFKVDPSG